jgi:selenocysteine lyase/cysteine desulfurase
MPPTSTDGRQAISRAGGGLDHRGEGGALRRNLQLSSGILCFEVDAMTPDAAVARLLEWRIVACASPYAKSYLRLAPSLVNSPADVDAVLIAVRSLARY